MKARLCALVVCASVIAVIAQSVDGKWSGEVQGGRGPQQVNLTLKADGGKVTVTDENGNVANVTIADVEQSNGVIHVIDKVLLPKM